MTIDWSEHDELLVRLIAEYGRRWSIISTHMPSYITQAAARNRWSRIVQKTSSGKNKCKLCGHLKRGHNSVECKRRQRENASEDGMSNSNETLCPSDEPVDEPADEPVDKCSELSNVTDMNDDVYNDEALSWDYSTLQHDFFLWPELKAHLSDVLLVEPIV